MGAAKKGIACAGVALVMALELAGAGTARASRNKVDENDPTYQLFQLLDTARGGVLKDFCVLANVYTDASGTEFRHVLRVNYDKNRAFGRLQLSVRSVGKMDPAQLAAYTPQQIFDFGEVDQEKFMKSEAGPLGGSGDLFLVSAKGEPLHTEPITPAARKQYEDFIAQYIIPAVKAAPAQ